VFRRYRRPDRGSCSRELRLHLRRPLERGRGCRARAHGVEGPRELAAPRCRSRAPLSKSPAAKPGRRRQLLDRPREACGIARLSRIASSAVVAPIPTSRISRRKGHRPLEVLGSRDGVGGGRIVEPDSAQRTLDDAPPSSPAAPDHSAWISPASGPDASAGRSAVRDDLGTADGTDVGRTRADPSGGGVRRLAVASRPTIVAGRIRPRRRRRPAEQVPRSGARGGARSALPAERRGCSSARAWWPTSASSRPLSVRDRKTRIVRNHRRPARLRNGPWSTLGMVIVAFRWGTLDEGPASRFGQGPSARGSWAWPPASRSEVDSHAVRRSSRARVELCGTEGERPDAVTASMRGRLAPDRQDVFSGRPPVGRPSLSGARR
jgi:hypothetical protein